MPTCSPATDTVSAHLTGLGAVEQLEARLSAHYGMRYAVAMPSATTGLMTLGLALDLRGGDFVAPPLTYGGSIAAWLALGASARFADVDRDSLTLSPLAVASALTPATRVVLGVDLFGMPCDDAALRCEADRHGLWFVVDAAQSLGARVDGRAAGKRADAVVVSFSSGKALDVGEGGAVLTGRRDIYERLIWHSQHPHRQKRELGLHQVNELAINGRIHPHAARLALRRFDRALNRIERRRRLVSRVVEALDDIPEVEIPAVAAGVEPSYHRLTVRRRTADAGQAVQRVLAGIGIDCAAGPIPASILYRHSSFMATADYWALSCPVLEQEWAARVRLRCREHSLSRRVFALDEAPMTA